MFDLQRRVILKKGLFMPLLCVIVKNVDSAEDRSGRKRKGMT